MDNEIKYEKVDTDNPSPFKVIEINVNPTRQTGKFNKHWHRSLEFIIPVESGIEAWIEGSVYHVYPETMVLVNSRQIHECTLIHPGNAYHGYAIQIKYSFLKEAFPDIDQYEFDCFYDVESHPYLFQLVHKIIKAYNVSSKYQYLKLQSLAYDFIYELVAHYCVSISEEKNIASSKNKTRMIDILSYLDKHASEPFDALTVADEFHISYSHLAKLFKNELGMSMKEYVNSVRVRQASFDLLTTSNPITDIALNHGFANTKAFYKEFEKVYHMTPKQYRKAK